MLRRVFTAQRYNLITPSGQRSMLHMLNALADAVISILLYRRVETTANSSYVNIYDNNILSNHRRDIISQHLIKAAQIPKARHKIVANTNNTEIWISEVLRRLIYIPP